MIFYCRSFLSARCRNVEPKDFLRFLQYGEFPAFVFVKAGSFYCLLNDNQAEIGGKEVAMSQARILGSSEVREKSKYEIATSLRR